MAFSKVYSQDSIYYRPQISTGKALEFKIDGINSFLFDSNLTRKYMQPIKSNKYKYYWRIDTCEIVTIEKEVKNYLIKHYNEVVVNKYPHYIRQYFPFINKKGEMIIIITLSFLNEEEQIDVMERLSLFPRYVFDDNVNFNYLSLRFNYTNRSWGETVQKKPSRSP
ncbi:MAG: hypothetical protein KF852_16410 [Saprospiraceae bacterium]|nr:hypothetical protein [Saprospiraceae bacterium]